jgi:hypothetical protein
MINTKLGVGMEARSNISWELVWTIPTPGVHLAEERAVARGNQLHRVVKTRQFAVIRNAYDSNGYYNGHGYVVSRHSFDDIRHFDTIEEAKLYVESVYALERH